MYFQGAQLYLSGVGNIFYCTRVKYFRNKITFLVRIRKWIANRGASVKLGRKGV